MRLRKLNVLDAPLMLEWMHDENVTCNLQANFAAKELKDCQAFIEYSQADSDNLHLAIVDDNDEYMGTVSLKNIKKDAMSAEFAISIRSCAMGKGISQYGMKEMIRIGLQEMGLKKIYWCVSPENKRAVRFYDKNGYVRLNSVPNETVGYSEEQKTAFFWYQVADV